MEQEAKKIIVDGANIAWEEKTEDGKPKLANILVVKRDLEKMGYNPIIIVDASLRHNIDDPDQFDELEKSQVLRQSPSGTDADLFVLEFGARFHVPVVSNDTFKERQEQYPWIRHDRVTVMIIDGKAEFHWPERNGNGNGNGHH
jgi:hypothetical protein